MFMNTNWNWLTASSRMKSPCWSVMGWNTSPLGANCFRPCRVPQGRRLHNWWFSQRCSDDPWNGASRKHQSRYKIPWKTDVEDVPGKIHGVSVQSGDLIFGDVMGCQLCQVNMWKLLLKAFERFPRECGPSETQRDRPWNRSLQITGFLSNDPMRVGILCLMQESNTFLNRKTEFHHFEEDLSWLQWNTGKDDRFASWMGASWKGLMLQVSRCRYLQHAPCLTGPFASKLWSIDGTDVFADWSGRAPGRIPGGTPWCDGQWRTSRRRCMVETVKKKVGTKPIIGTLDLHANLSERMVESTNALIGYRSNPTWIREHGGLKPLFDGGNAPCSSSRPTRCFRLSWWTSKNSARTFSM